LEVNGILVDTNAHTAFAAGDRGAIDIFHAAPIVALNAVIVGELRTGISLGSRSAANMQHLAAFLSRPRVVLLNIDEQTEDVYCSVSIALRQLGRPIPTNDIWIAASALPHGVDLFSYDAHFRTIPQLRVGTKLSDFP
jgi:predicted nucleic acid-binding protein